MKTKIKAKPKAKRPRRPTSAPKGNIHQRILAAMTEMKDVPRNHRSEFGTYTYASHEDVVKATRDILIRHGIHVRFTVTDGRVERFTVNDVLWFQADVTGHISLVNADDPTDAVHHQMSGYALDKGDKAMGAAVSYVKKYLLTAAFMLTTGEDTDATTPEPGRAPAPEDVEPEPESEPEPMDAETRTAHATVNAIMMADDLDKMTIPKLLTFVQAAARVLGENSAAAVPLLPKAKRPAVLELAGEMRERIRLWSALENIAFKRTGHDDRKAKALLAELCRLRGWTGPATAPMAELTKEAKAWTKAGRPVMSGKAG